MLHIERIRKDIVALGHRAVAARLQRNQALERAVQWLREVPDSVALRTHLAPLLQADGDRWSGAVPTTDQPINDQILVQMDALAQATNITLIGVDGSQIYPDRHAAVLYYLLQVGALIFRYNGELPETYCREWLRYEETDLYDDHGYLIGGDRLALERAVKEMEVLTELTAAECQRHATATVFALTDGPLLWPFAERGQSVGQECRAYLAAMRRIQETGGTVVGYVDRPGGSPLLDALWTTQLAPEDVNAQADRSPLGRLTDYDLMVEVLKPGMRTPWFTRPTKTNQQHAYAGQEIWFCYINVGTSGSGTIARLEMPAWACDNENNTARLHAALHHQAQALNGYPYVLARAHEEALVTTKDKVALEQAILRELIESGIVARPSEKAHQKQLLGGYNL